jgi:hypothetical protein
MKFYRLDTNIFGYLGIEVDIKEYYSVKETPLNNAKQSLIHIDCKNFKDLIHRKTNENN